MKPHIEMAFVDLAGGWTALNGFAGLEVKVLADDLDESTLTGSRTRLVRFGPGALTTNVLKHRYWEEVFVLSGDMYPLHGPSQASVAPMYSLRPPGTDHGPFGSRDGCVLFEVQYFAK